MAPRTPPTHPRILITSGPTREPIDRVRYLGNNSSGRLGAALADAAAQAGHAVTLLLGPQAAEPLNTNINITRFQTAADLQSALADQAPHCDILIMAAAVADYRPIPHAETDPSANEKLKRTPAELTLRLEPTPDLIAAEAARKRPDQFFVAFALEPRDRLIESAIQKLDRKNVDAIVANPLETMGADGIEAFYISTRRAHIDTSGAHASTNGPVRKPEFAKWLLALISEDLTSPRRPLDQG